MNKKVLLTIVMLTLVITVLVPMASADSSRFSGKSYLSRVETQEDIDTLPKTLDASGFDIGILVEGSGLILDGFEITASNGDDDMGIAVDAQSNVKVSNCEIIGGYLGIYYYNSSGMINHNYVHDYMKNGITSNNPSVDGKHVDIKWNQVVGRGPLEAGDYAQNGIQIGYGSIAHVMFNDVSNNYYIPDNWVATGILVFESSESIIQGNYLESNDAGIAIQTWAWFVVEASTNKIIKNTIVESDWAITVDSIAWDGYTSEGNPICNDNKVINNKISDSEFGISYGAYDASATYDPITDNTKIISNKMQNVDTPIDDYGGDTNTKVHANAY